MSADRVRKFSWPEVEWFGVLVAAALTLAIIAASVASGDVATEPKEPTSANIVSPWTGMFIASDFPGGQPYVTVGTHVGPGTIVGRIETVYAESMPQIPVLAGVEGTIVEVLVADGDMVQIGQPLYRVAPDEPRPITVR